MIPNVGKAIGVLRRGGVRMALLVLGVVFVLVCGLRALWAVRPISWHADDPVGLERRRRTRRALRRALGDGVAGGLVVAVLATIGLANATFTNTPTRRSRASEAGSFPRRPG